MLASLTDVFSQVMQWFGTFVTALTSETGSLHALLPLMFIGVAVSIVLVAVKVVRKIMWGN